MNPFKDILNPEYFWIAFGSMATATALIYTILKSRIDHRSQVKNIKKALKLELITNIEMLFSGEVERPSLFDIIHLVRTQYIQDIKDQKTVSIIQRLYINLEYYQTFVKKVYLNFENSGVPTTEKQLQICNTFLEYFGENPVEYDMTERNDWNQRHQGKEYIDFKRDEAIKTKNRRIENWERKIQSDIDLIFP
jgi:hypothetical protein